MSLRVLRDAAIADIKGGMARTFRQVDSAPRTISAAWVQRVSTRTPACFVGFTAIRQMKRTASGSFVGPVELAGHCVAADKTSGKAQDVVLDLMSDLAMHVEKRSFGVENAGGAIVTAIENIFSIDQDEGGFAIGTVTWTNQFLFGHDYLAEELASESAQWGYPKTLRTLLVERSGGGVEEFDLEQYKP